MNRGFISIIYSSNILKHKILLYKKIDVFINLQSIAKKLFR